MSCPVPETETPMGYGFALGSTDGDVFEGLETTRASSRMGIAADGDSLTHGRFPAAASGNNCTGRARVALASSLLEG
jgi:hypothetical protein